MLPTPRLQDEGDTFMQIVHGALALGIVDVFTVISWSTSGTPADEIVAEIAARTQARKEDACQPL